MKIHPADNVLEALTDLNVGHNITINIASVMLPQAGPAKHKFAEVEFTSGDEIRLCGILVGKATTTIPSGGVIAVNNVNTRRHPLVKNPMT